ncbi:MAG: DNA polymerase III subunit delta' [Thermodesulfobacteriota bacterium]
MPAFPFTFDKLLGQPRAKTLLQRAVAGGRLGHAFLLRGPFGVGKKRLATSFAAGLLCQRPAGADPCGTCGSCRKLVSGNHPDFLPVSADGASIKINQIRELQKQLAYPPFESRRRLTLIADIQLMGVEAANSLLKTLEEPPADNVLLLTVDSASQPLATISSRCQTIPCLPIESELVADFLIRELELAPTEAAALADLAEGSIGRAMRLRESGMAELRRSVITCLETLTPEMPQAVETIFALAARAAELKELLPDFLDLLQLWLRDRLVLDTGHGELLRSGELLAVLGSRGKRWPPAEIDLRQERIRQAKIRLRFNCNRATVCESLFFSLL